MADKLSNLSDAALNRRAAALFRVRDPENPVPFCQSLDACRMLEDLLFDLPVAWRRFEDLIAADTDPLRCTPRQRAIYAIIAMEEEFYAEKKPQKVRVGPGDRSIPK